MDAKTIKGLAIVSITEGAKLGRVEEVVFDPQAMRVAAVLVGGDGQTFAIPFEKLTSIGADAIMVDSSQVTQALSQGDTLSGLPSLRHLTGLKVVDEAGTLVGAVAGIDIDGTTGRVLTLTIHKGGVMGIGQTTTALGVAAIRSIGAELITVGIDAAVGASV